MKGRAIIGLNLDLAENPALELGLFRSKHLRPPQATSFLYFHVTATWWGERPGLLSERNGLPHLRQVASGEHTHRNHMPFSSLCKHGASTRTCRRKKTACLTLERRAVSWCSGNPALCRWVSAGVTIQCECKGAPAWVLLQCFVVACVISVIYHTEILQNTIMQKGVELQPFSVQIFVIW